MLKKNEVVVTVFVFKQKTAYEMRISDWSSDVCSSDLSARELVAHGHRVLVETGAGEGIGAHDRFYEEAGAQIVATATEIFAAAEMIVKVKEPQPAERAMLREGQILYTYLHLAPDPAQTTDLMAHGAVCLPHQTVPSPPPPLPLLQ